MLRVRLILLLLMVYGAGWSQYLTQGADGKGSIPLPLKGSAVSVDIGQASVTFGINNYKKVFDTVANRLFFGAGITAKSAGGLASLFSSGDIVPEGNLTVFGGYSFSNNARMAKKINGRNEAELLRRTELALEKELKTEYKIALLHIVTDNASFITDLSARKKAVNDLTQLINDNPANSNLFFNNLLTDYDPNNILLNNFRTTTISKSKSVSASFTKKNLDLQNQYSKLITEAQQVVLKGLHPWRVSFFVPGGIEARNFTRFIQLDRTNFSNSFKDTLYRGGNVGVGVNGQFDNIWFGLKYDYVKGDNYSMLSGKEYTIRTTDTSGNQSLIREKKQTAYAGNYSRVETNQLSIDLVGDFRLNDTSRVLANLYLRSTLHSRDTAFIPNYTNVGAGVYFIGKKGKFMGGLYAELPDINNNAEKSKPENEIHIRPPLRKLSFGIVTKFNLSSMFSFY